MDFGFKKLVVGKKSIDFSDKILNMVENLNSGSKHLRIIDQIEASTVSIPSNIAEAKGRESKKEYIRFFYIVRGSLHETISILTLFKKRKWISNEQLNKLEKDGLGIANMLKGLILASDVEIGKKNFNAQ